MGVIAEVAEVWGLLDMSFDGGLVRGDKLLSFFREFGIDCNIEDMPCAYGAVAAELQTGQEHWLRTGNILQAVRASCTFPGLFRPVKYNDRWLIDGGLVNPRRFHCVEPWELILSLSI